MSETHECPTNGCGAQLPYSVLACKRHWFMLPPPLRAEINRTWRSGDLPAYLAAREAAEAFLNGTGVKG